MNSLLHNEGDKSIQNINIYNLPLCNVINLTVEQLYSQLKYIPNNGIILVPGYKEPDGQLSLQLALTGKYKYDESLSEGIAREVAEELGFSIDLSKIKCKKLYNNKKDIYFSSINLSDCLSSQEFKTTNTNKDNFKKRLTCWVYFKEESYPIITSENFLMITSRKRIESDDEAGKYIFGIPKNIMEDILMKWKNNEVSYQTKFLFKVN